jgi:energy-coupling factor transport system substrate-specific component
MTGVAKVSTNTVSAKLCDFKMLVPFISCDDTIVYPGKDGSFSIPPSVKKLTIHGHICDYSLTNPQLSYCLKGFDSRATLIRKSGLAPVSYTNLKGGEYHFVIQLLDRQGKAYSTLDVPIRKREALHEQLWANLALLLILVHLLVGSVTLYVRYRTRRFQRKEQEQRQLIREIVESFAKVIDMKDKYTNGHSSRVAEYTRMLARELGYDEDTVEKFYNIALLHDIGKIGIPSEILNKPGKLTDLEFNMIKSHSALGYEALKDISIMPELAIGAGAHHERPDGRGYPKGLSGNQIPRVAQIITVADTFDAMYSDRPYRKRMNFDKAVSIIKEVSGSQLVPDVVDAFLRLVERGQFKDPADHGGGTTEDINNIRSKYK